MADKNPKPEVTEEEPKVSAKTEKQATADVKPAKEKYKYDGVTPPLNIFLHWCKACNLCIAFCPTKVLEPDRDGKPILAHPEKWFRGALLNKSISSGRRNKEWRT